MQTKINPADGAEMLLVPAGEFSMGITEEQVREYCSRTSVDPSNFDIMRPHRRIYLDEFWIYRTPITYGQYREFCRANRKSEMPRNVVNLANLTELDMDDSYPVVFINWFSAVAYCKWANVQLPTEAQWEKAARGVCGQLFPWGNTWDPHFANFDIRKPPGRRAEPCPVEAYAEGASPYGVLQMSGNVNEWCRDFFAPYGFDKSPFKNILDVWKFSNPHSEADAAKSVVKNPTGPSKGTSRVVRGSSWANANPTTAGLTTYRSAENPNQNYRDVGFRPVSLSPI